MIGLRGAGIHSGVEAQLYLHPEPGPLRFRTPAGEIPAALSAVVDTRRSTTLAAGAARITMVEHLLAACSALNLWANLVVECDSEELPILDGSAAPYAEALRELALPLSEAPPALEVTAPFEWRDGGSVVRVEPGPRSFAVSIDFDHRAIGRQRVWVEPAAFEGVLPARTFGLASEMEQLKALGLARGAIAGRGILFSDDGPSDTLRMADEPVRHKALDALGDFHLLGRPLAGGVSIHRGSHRAHVEALRALLAEVPL